jgi:hypothetical protein
VADEDIKDRLKRLLDEIEVLRNQAREKGRAFSAPTAEHIEKKLTSAHTPFIYSNSWTPIGSPGNTFAYDITVNNPDPNGYYNLYAYVFFGPANMVPDVGTALLTVDERLFRGFARFPYMSPGSNGTVLFNYTFPRFIPLGTYIGNAFIFLQNFHDVGTYADRASIYVELS